VVARPLGPLAKAHSGGGGSIKVVRKGSSAVQYKLTTQRCTYKAVQVRAWREGR
jgi:hypothetical protein